MAVNPPACADCKHCVKTPRGKRAADYACRLLDVSCYDARKAGGDCGPAGEKWER
jgi:hypothetical protein